MDVATLNKYGRGLKKENGDRWNCALCLKQNVDSAQNKRKSLMDIDK